MASGIPDHLTTANLPTMLDQVARGFPGASVRLAVVVGRPAGAEPVWQGAVTWDDGPSAHRVAVAANPLEALATALRLVITHGRTPGATAPAKKPAPPAVEVDDLLALPSDPEIEDLLAL